GRMFDERGCVRLGGPGWGLANSWQRFVCGQRRGRRGCDRYRRKRHAVLRIVPWRMNSTTRNDPQYRMTFSPIPVAPAAPTSLSTYKPLPRIGEPPTRPAKSYATPLVEHPP